MTDDLISRKALLESLLERMAGVYAEYHREIVQDELNDTLDLINSAPTIQQCVDGEPIAILHRKILEVYNPRLTIHEKADVTFLHVDETDRESEMRYQSLVDGDYPLFTHSPYQTARIKELEAKNKELENQVDGLQDKIIGIVGEDSNGYPKTCACSWDCKDDICGLHSPKLTTANDKIAELTAKCEQMREALESILNQLSVSQPTRDTMQLIREAIATVKGKHHD